MSENFRYIKMRGGYYEKAPYTPPPLREESRIETYEILLKTYLTIRKTLAIANTLTDNEEKMSLLKSLKQQERDLHQQISDLFPDF